MARELHINITTDADLGALDRLIAGFEQLEKAVKGLGRKNSMESMSKNLNDAKSSVRELNNEVVKLNRNMSNMVKNMGKMGGGTGMNAAMAKTQKAQAASIKSLTALQNKAERDRMASMKRTFTMQAKSAETQKRLDQENARNHDRMIKNLIRQDDAYNAKQNRNMLASAKMQARTLTTNQRNQEAAMARLYRNTRGLVGSKVRGAEGPMGQLFQGTPTPFGKLDKGFEDTIARQRTQMQRMGDSQAQLQRAEQNMQRFWNTVNAGAQSLTKRGFSRSLGELNSQMKQFANIRTAWEGQIRSLREYQAELKDTERDLQRLYRMQNEQRRAARGAGDMATAGIREQEMRQTLAQIRTTRGAQGDINTRVGNVRGEMQNIEAAIQQVTAAMTRGEQGQAQYQSRLQQLRSQMALSDANFRRMQMGIVALSRTFSQASGAISQFAGALRSRLNSAFSAANASIKSLSTNVGSRFASMRAQLDATGKTFLGFGRQAKTGFSQADIALNEFFSAGWSLLASGSIVKMFGSNILRNMFGGLSDYSELEQQMVRLGISGGMWQPADRAGFLPSGEPIAAGQASPYAAGDMRGMQELVFGLQSGRLAGIQRPMTAFNATELTDALYFFSSAIGSDLLTQGKATAQALEPLLRVASVTQTSPETLIKGSLNTLMQYGYDPRAIIEDASLGKGNTDIFTQMAGMVAVASNVSSMEVSDIFEAFKMMGPALHKLTGATQGAGLEDAMAAIFMASEVGLKGGNVGRGLDRLVTQLLDPDGPMKETIKKYFGDDATIKGLFFDESGYLRGGLKGVFDTLLNSGLEGPQLASMMGELFTQNASRAGVGLLDPEKLKGTGPGSWAWFESMMSEGRIEEFMSTATSAMENTVTASMTNVGNAWQMITTMIVESVRGDLINAFTEVADVLWDVGYAIKDNPALGRFVTMLGLLAGGVASAVGGLMVFGGTILLVARAFSMLGGMVAPVLQLLMMLPSILAGVAPLFLILGAAAAVAFVAWDQNLRGIQDRVRGFVDGLSLDGVMTGATDVLIWLTRIGDAFIDLAKGPILGLSDTAVNLQALLQDVFGEALGAEMTQGLFDLGEGVRNFITNTDMGEGRLASFRDRLADVGTIASNIAPALRGMVDLFVLGATGIDNWGAIENIADVLGIEDYASAAWQAVRMVRSELEMLVGLAQTVGGAWQGAFDAVANMLSSMTQGNAFAAMLGGALLFVNSVAVGFATTLVRVASLVTQLANRATEAFGKVSSEVASAEREVFGFEVTITGVISAIGTAIGVYLGTRLLTALMPGFTMIARLGTALGQLGIMFISVGAQAALFGARMVVGLATAVVQITAVTAALLVQVAAWAAHSAAASVNTLITNANAAANAVLAASATGAAAAEAAMAAGTLGLSGALTILNAVLMGSIAIFAGAVLAAGAFAAGLFIVVAATQGIDAAIAQTVSFLEAFWQGLQVGIAAVQAFIAVIATIGSGIGAIIETFTGATSAVEQFGIALGLVASIGLIGIVAAFAGLIGLMATAALGFVGIRGAALLAIMAFGEIGFGLIGLEGPFQTVIGLVGDLIDKLGVLGEVAAIAMFSASGRKWVGAIGIQAAKVVARHPAMLAAGATILGGKMFYDEAQQQWVSDTAQGQHEQRMLQYSTQGNPALNFSPNTTGPQNAAYWREMSRLGVFNSTDMGYFQSMNAGQDLLTQGVNVNDPEAYANVMEALELRWEEPYDRPVSGQDRYLAMSMADWFRQETASGGGNAAAAQSLLNQRLIDAGLDETYAGEVAAQTGAQIERTNARLFEEQGFVPNLDATTYIPPISEQSTSISTLDEAQAFLDDWIARMGLDDNLGDIANSKFVRDNAGFFELIGMDPAKGDWTPDLEGLMNVSDSAEYDPLIESMFPGLEEYRKQMDEYTAFQEIVERFGGDRDRAADFWEMNTGQPAPTKPLVSDIYGGQTPEQAMQESDARDTWVQGMVDSTEAGMLLVESLDQGFSSLFGRTSAGRAFGSVVEGIWENISALEYEDGTSVLEANDWFTPDEMMANAAIYGGGFGQETAGKNLQNIMRPMLEQTAADLGVDVQTLMAGVPRYFYDEALMPTTQTLLYSRLSELGPEVGRNLDQLGTELDESTGRVFSTMGLEWGNLAAYAAGQAMEGNDWDLSHFIMEEWDLTQQQATDYLEQNGIDARLINDDSFEGVRAAALSSNGEVAAATTEFWDWMYDATAEGTTNMVSITEEEFAKIPEAWRILASNQGLRFNIIDENDVEHQAATIDKFVDSVKNAEGALGQLLDSPGVSAVNRMLTAGGQPGRDEAGNLTWEGGTPMGGGSWWEKPGTSFVETATNYNQLLAAGADSDAATQGLVETYDAATDTYTILNELNGFQITIPAPEYEEFKQGAEAVQEELQRMYDDYVGATKPGTANNPFGDSPMGVGGSDLQAPDPTRSFEEWYRDVFDVEDFEVPKLSQEESFAILSGGIDGVGALEYANTLATDVSNEIQSTISNSMNSDTQIQSSIEDALTSGFEGVDVVARATEIGDEIRTAITTALSGGGEGAAEENAGTPQRGAAPSSGTAAGPFDSIFEGYATSASTAFGTQLQTDMAVELGKINFVGGEGGAAKGGPFVSQFEGFATTAAAAFGTSLQAALPAAVSGGLALSYIFSNAGAEWGAAAGAAFASAFAAASTGVQAGGFGGAGSGGGNLGPDGNPVPYGPGGGQGIIDEGGGATTTNTITTKLILDRSQFDSAYATVTQILIALDLAEAIVDISADFSDFITQVGTVNTNLVILENKEASPSVTLNTAPYFAAVDPVVLSLFLLGQKVATPTVNLIDNASGPLQTILGLINSIPASKTSVINVTTNNTTTNTTINRTGTSVGPTESFASGGVVASDFQIVGDTWGPELVELPRGSRIHNAWETDKLLDQNMLAASPFTTASAQGRMAPTTNNNINVTINNPVVRSDQDIKDISRQVSRELGKQMEAATRGQHPRV